MIGVVKLRLVRILSLAAAFLIFADGPSAQAQAISCDALIELLIKSSEEPRVAINLADQSVLVTSTLGHCSESVEDWSRRTQGRGLRGLFTKPGTKKAPAVTRPAPPPKEPEPAEKDLRPELLTHPLDAQAPLPTPAQPLGSGIKTAEPCSRRMREFWHGMILEIDGSVHWLVSVYTIDINKDLITDNIGFRLISSNRSERIIRYFEPQGELSAKNFPEFRLEDDDIVPRICFGQLNFEANLEPVTVGEKKAFEVPDLAKEADRKKKAAENTDEGGVGLWIALLVFVFVFAAGGFFLWRGMSSRKNDDDEDDDDYEDEEDNEE